MDDLVRQNDLGLSERLAVGMKRMIFAARAKDVATVKKTMSALSRVLPQTPEHLRVAKYNYAHALFELGMMDECVTATLDLIVEYYDLLGLTLGDVMAKNPDKIFPLLKGDHNHTDDLKHLADFLDLQAKAIKATETIPAWPPLRARHLRQHEDRGGDNLRRQGPAIQSPLPSNVRALSRRASGLHAGLGLGKGPGREPGRSRA